MKLFFQYYYLGTYVSLKLECCSLERNGSIWLYCGLFINTLKGDI